MGWREKAHRAKRLHRPTLKDWTRDGWSESFPGYASPFIEGHDAYCYFKVGASSSAADGVHEVKWTVDDYRANNGTIGDDNVNEEKMMIPAVLDAKDTPPELFHSKYEARCIPVVIRDVPYGVHCNQQQQHVQNQTDRHNNEGHFQEEKKECDDGRTDVHMDDVSNSSRDQSQDVRIVSQSNHTSKPWPAVKAWSLSALYHDEQLRSRMFKVGEDDDGYTGKFAILSALISLQTELIAETFAIGQHLNHTQSR